MDDLEAAALLVYVCERERERALYKTEREALTVAGAEWMKEKKTYYRGRRNNQLKATAFLFPCLHYNIIHTSSRKTCTVVGTIADFF